MLLSFERSELFEPVFRVRRTEPDSPPFQIPMEQPEMWKESPSVYDTTAVPHEHETPKFEDRDVEGYYSIFQSLHLKRLLSQTTLHVNLVSFIEEPKSTDSSSQVESLFDRTKKTAPEIVAALKQHTNFRAIALLCQHVSDRYYPKTQSDRRTFFVSPHFYTDEFIAVSDKEWSWDREVENWDPGEVEDLYGLSPEILAKAYSDVSLFQSHIDPLENWYELTQFVSAELRSKLLGDALAAKTFREGAELLTLLHRDLYGVDLKHPNEVGRTVLVPLPELAVRTNPRRHLEFVANRFGVNPQPKLSLFVEGESECIAINEIFTRYFNTHPGTFGIEIVDLKGVNQATGGKGEQYAGMVRLIDYLHSRHTHTFLILDNENRASNLKKALASRTSIHFHDRFVTDQDWVKIWDHSLEFDNFSRTEISNALREMANSDVEFSIAEIARVRDGELRLETLYHDRTGRGLNKPELVRVLLEEMFSQNSRRRIENRAIIKVLGSVIALATRDSLPDSHQSWQAYQSAGRFGTSKKGRIESKSG